MTRSFVPVIVLSLIVVSVSQTQAQAKKNLDIAPLLQDSLSNQDNSSRKTYALRLRAGFKSAESAMFFGTKAGWGFGMAIRLPLEEYLGLYLEFNYWKAQKVDGVFSEDVVYKDFALALSQTIFIEPIIVDLLVGVGAGGSALTPTRNTDQKPPTKNGVFCLNLEVNLSKQISKSVWASLYVRNLRSASLNPGGGESYTPWLIGLGTEFSLN